MKNPLRLNMEKLDDKEKHLVLREFSQMRKTLLYKYFVSEYSKYRMRIFKTAMRDKTTEPLFKLEGAEEVICFFSFLCKELNRSSDFDLHTSFGMEES